MCIRDSFSTVLQFFQYSPAIFAVLSWIFFSISPEFFSVQVLQIFRYKACTFCSISPANFSVQVLNFFQYKSCKFFSISPANFSVQVLQIFQYKSCTFCSISPALFSVQVLKFFQYKSWNFFSTSTEFFSGADFAFFRLKNTRCQCVAKALKPIARFVVALCLLRSPCLFGKALLLQAYAPLSQKIFDFSGTLYLFLPSPPPRAQIVLPPGETR